MNIHNLNSDLISDELFFKFNQFFIEYQDNKKKITFDNLLEIIKNFGYIPNQYEINDVKSEIGEYIDKTYYFVIIGRIVRKMSSKESINELKKCFEIIDMDKNGTIEKEELFKMMKTYIKIPPSKDEIESFFNEMDLNHDGHITFNEFLEFIQLK